LPRCPETGSDRRQRFDLEIFHPVPAVTVITVVIAADPLRLYRLRKARRSFRIPNAIRIASKISKPIK
jgi:hypothetical protein